MTLSTYDTIMWSKIFGKDGQVRLVIVERETSTVEVSHDSTNLWLLSAKLSTHKVGGTRQGSLISAGKDSQGR
jgi:hypothetical protein